MNILYYILSLLSLASASTVVDLGYASYKGQTLSNGVTQWLGIRYAAPPVGDLRFAAPEDPLDMEGIQQANEFGGNPKHVVIGGDSAGGTSVALMLSAYGGKDEKLFVAAASESQSFGTMLNVSESQFAYDELVTATACDSSKDTLACLRELDVHSLQAKNINRPYPGAKGKPLFLYGPTIDEDLVPDYTYRLFNEGKFIKVPVIFGDDTNEGTTFVPKKVSSVAEADTFIKKQFPYMTQSQMTRINSMYLTANQTETFPGAGPYWRPASKAYGEIRYICPGIKMSSIYADAGVPSWNYHYAVQDPAKEASGMGTDHTVEVHAIWGPENTGQRAPASYTTTNAAIVPLMQAYWTSFIVFLDPNTKRLSSSPKWQTWGDDAYRRIFIRTGKTKMETVPQKQRSRCQYLTSIGVALRQ
ncbi:CAZyme family CE10 [Penicillium paradoxum]|uniref:CAZyme family CE10 n=1 Tax=Penicillium paradoxum TaxID=176176 RepID=UPI002546592A|nr:CAZyme family CE10 [Penicillium paradoxum]KAJ5782218.1 CAZyme family CE10 [Penicillium paradoxum]